MVNKLNNNNILSNSNNHKLVNLMTINLNSSNSSLSSISHSREVSLVIKTSIKIIIEYE